jgi:putative oxidoreductase
VALIVGLWPRWTALALIGFSAATIWMTYGPSVTGLIFRPRQNVELFQNLAIIGGLLFYFSSGPGGWSRTSLR